MKKNGFFIRGSPNWFPPPPPLIPMEKKTMVYKTKKIKLTGEKFPQAKKNSLRN